MRLHAIIISWNGYADKACAIAHALEGSVDALTVIYSSADAQQQEGPGTWLQVPNSWYFGRKFHASLEAVGPDDLMLQIQADAHSDDWPALAAGCAQCFTNHRDVALWTPDVNWSPWHAEVVGDGMLAQTNLLQVSQTDGIVWAIHPALYPALRTPDYTPNNLGWGIDWLALLETQKRNMIAVRDLSYPVSHPYGRGYHNMAAAQHMKNFLTQLPLADQREILSQHDALEARKRAFAGAPTKPDTAPPTPETTLMPWPFFRAPLAAKTSQAFVIAGHVYVKAAARNIQAEAAIEYGGIQTPLTRMDTPPPRGHITHPFPLHATESKTAYQQVNGLKEWQVDGWPTLRVIPDFAARVQSITLSGDMTLAPADAPQMFTANLAVHRGKGDLIICLSNMQGKVLHEFPCRFETAYWGGDQSQNYKLVQIPLPVHDQSLRLTLRIETQETPETTADQPAVFFVARPRLRSADNDALLTPAVVQAKKPRGDAVWYSAQLDLVAQTDARHVTLIMGKARTPLLSVPDVQITLIKDHGHMLELYSDHALTATLWRDGAPCYVVALELGENTLRLPLSETQTTPALLELRDTSGTLTLWHSWHVPSVQSPPPVQEMPARDLLARTTGRMDAVRQHLATPADLPLLPQLETILTALEAGPDVLTLTPLRVPDVTAPQVSIVITAAADIAVTYTCLAAVLLAWNRASYEVTLLADATQAPQIKALFAGVTVAPNMNAAATQARAPYIALLEARTEVTSGWLDALIAAFNTFENVGLAGAKLLHPDGRLCSAGGLAMDTPQAYGAGQHPDDPRYCYARQVDYVPGSALMTRKDIWQSLGTLDTDYGSSPSADVGFAHRMRAAGHTTWYVPAATVYLNANAELAAASSQQADPDCGITGRVLLLSRTAPTLAMTAPLRATGYKITSLAGDMHAHSPHTPDLQNNGVEVITAPFHTDPNSFLKARGREFDVFYILGCDLAQTMVPAIRGVHPLARLVLATTQAPKADDFDIMRSVDVVLSHSETAHALIAAQQDISVLRGDILTPDTLRTAFVQAGVPQ